MHRIPLAILTLLLLATFPRPASSQDAAAVRKLSLVWEYPTPSDTPQAIVADALDRPLLHVAMKQGGLVTLDVSKPNRPPTERARLPIDRFDGLQVMHLTQVGELVYVALGEFFHAQGAPAGLAIVNVKDPRRPRVTAKWKSAETLKGAAHVLVEDGTAYLAAMSAGVMAFDVSRPDRIERRSVFQPDVNYPSPNPKATHHPNARGLTLRDRTLFVAYDEGGLRTLDVSNPSEMREIGRYVNPKFPNKPQAFNSLVLDGSLAYVAVDYAGLEVVEVRNPRELRQVGWWNPWKADTLGNLWFNSGGHTNQIAWDAKRKQVWLSAGDSELQVVDVSQPARPRLVARYGESQDKLGAWGVTLVGSRAYLSYMTAVVPFQSRWSGIKAVE